MYSPPVPLCLYTGICCTQWPWLFWGQSWESLRSVMSSFHLVPGWDTSAQRIIQGNVVLKTSPLLKLKEEHKGCLWPQQTLFSHGKTMLVFSFVLKMYKQTYVICAKLRLWCKPMLILQFFLMKSKLLALTRQLGLLVAALPCEQLAKDWRRTATDNGQQTFGGKEPAWVANNCYPWTMCINT